MAQYEYTRSNGTVETADSLEDAMSRCPILGQMGVELAKMALDVAKMGNEATEPQGDNGDAEQDGAAGDDMLLSVEPELFGDTLITTEVEPTEDVGGADMSVIAVEAPVAKREAEPQPAEAEEAIADDQSPARPKVRLWDTTPAKEPVARAAKPTSEPEIEAVETAAPVAVVAHSSEEAQGADDPIAPTPQHDTSPVTKAPKRPAPLQQEVEKRPEVAPIEHAASHPATKLPVAEIEQPAPLVNNVEVVDKPDDVPEAISAVVPQPMAAEPLLPEAQPVITPQPAECVSPEPVESTPVQRLTEALQQKPAPTPVKVEQALKVHADAEVVVQAPDVVVEAPQSTPEAAPTPKAVVLEQVTPERQVIIDDEPPQEAMPQPAPAPEVARAPELHQPPQPETVLTPEPISAIEPVVPEIESKPQPKPESSHESAIEPEFEPKPEVEPASAVEHSPEDEPAPRSELKPQPEPEDELELPTELPVVSELAPENNLPVQPQDEQTLADDAPDTPPQLADELLADAAEVQDEASVDLYDHDHGFIQAVSAFAADVEQQIALVIGKIAIKHGTLL